MTRALQRLARLTGMGAAARESDRSGASRSALPIRRAMNAWFLALLFLAAFGGCRKSSETDTLDDVGAAKPPAAVSARVAFPESLRTGHADVDDFLLRAMGACAMGDYDELRILWTRHEPSLPRDQFDEGWRAVQTITVEAVERAWVRRDPDQPDDALDEVYIVLARVRLDPAHQAGRIRPDRRVALLLVHEEHQWKLAWAPKPMREWINDKHASRGAGDSHPVVSDDRRP